MAKAPKETLPTTTQEAGPKVNLPANVAKNYRLGQRITVPIHSLTHHGDIACLFLGEISTQAVKEDATSKDKPMAVALVRDLDTGHERTLIVPTVLEAALRRVPGGYKDKAFMVAQGPKMPGKRYYQIELFQLEA